MKRAGFTMIELIFVIVILGILAAVAVPRMNNLTGDARLANANESYCLHTKPMLFPFSARNNGSLAGFDFLDIYTQQEIGAHGFAYTGNTVLAFNDNLVGVQDNQAAVQANVAILSDVANDIYIHILDGNTTDSYRCFVSDNATITDNVDAVGLRADANNYVQ